MAPKKEEELVEEIVEETPADSPEDLLEIMIPITKEHQEDVFIRVNQRTWQIQRGKRVKLPRCAVEVYQHSEEALAEMIEYIQKNAKG